MVSKTDSSGTTSYVYNSENRLVQLTTPNAQLVTFKYDPFGRRIEKTVTDTVNGTRTTRYVYDREDIIFELDRNGNIITEYLHGPGIDEPIAMIRGGQTYYYHRDGLGSIIAITDSAGRVVQRYEYDSFGAITYTQDATFKQPYTYTGREYDDESGLYYYRARYYDAKVGRFLQEDPFRGFLRHPQTQNRYSYTQNNPINFKDPFGLHTYIDRGKTPDGGNRYDVYDDKGNYTETITTDKPAIYDVAEGAGVCVDKALNNPATEALDKIPPGQPITGNPNVDKLIDIFQILRAAWNEIWNSGKK